VWSGPQLDSHVGRSLLKLPTAMESKPDSRALKFGTKQAVIGWACSAYRAAKTSGSAKEFRAMTNILRFIQIFALGTWVGSIFYFSAAVAPGAFRVLSNPDQAGEIVQFTLGRLHMLGVVAALLYLFASIALAQSFKGLVRPAAIGVMLMLVLTLTSQRLVTPKLAALRAQMGSVAATPKTDPLRVEFDRLHVISVNIEGSVLLIGFAALFLTVRERL
jgi:uncharacterized membrane protein